MNSAAAPNPAASLVFAAPRALAFWHLASLDAPTVAIVWSLAFAWAGRVQLPMWVPLLLALVTWSVYVIDRLLDASAGIREPSSHILRERHIFHWRHRRMLLPMAIGSACAALVIILVFMPPITRARDSVLAAAALAYFSGVHSGCGAWKFPFRWPRSFARKEFFVAVLFTAGCALPAWHQPHMLAAPSRAAWAFWIPAAAFAALAWLNCTCIQRWESSGASRGAPLASANRMPHSRRPAMVFIAGLLLACASLLVALAGASHHPRSAALLAAGCLSSLLLAILDRTRHRFSPLALRATADLVLLTPLALLLCAGVRH